MPFCPQGTTQLPTEEFSRDFILGVRVPKPVKKYSSPYKIERKLGALHQATICSR